MSLKSNYNFVPAPKEDKIYKPEWREQVSHDIPFEDGESGIIRINITAKTPIFIRNGHSPQTNNKAKTIIEKWAREEAEPLNEEEQKTLEDYFSFSNIENEDGTKKYFIPATSVKGMLRNVVEILANGRMKQVSDDRYSFRNLTRGSDYMKLYKSNQVECGWLFEDKNGDWKIEDCEQPFRISHQDLDRILKTNFRAEFLNLNPKEKTAKYKYKQVRTSLKHKFKIKPDQYKKLVVQDDNGREGTIVLTGQSGKRIEEPHRKPSGKLFEFVFFTPQKEKPLIEITDKQKIDFKFIYLDHDKNNISKDWEFWQKKLELGEKIPVFFNRSEEATRVKHFGLAYMYKLPYKYSIHQIYPYKTYDFKEKDIAETIFGTTDESTSSLKGRVMVAHAFSDNAIQSEQLSKEILAGPKASYFPFYIDQSESSKKLKTYNDEHIQVRGFKRYPVHNNVKFRVYNKKQSDNPKVFSFFRPLKSGTEFSCSIRFHNLKKIEIGALISAITFHQQGDQFFHTLGAAKPFGYGKIKVKIEELQFLKHSIVDYLLAFEEKMEEKFPGWLNDGALSELLALASNPKTPEHEDKLIYPSIEIPNVPKEEANEFKNYEKEGSSLLNYTSINGLSNPVSIIRKKETNKLVEQGKYSFNIKSLPALKNQIKTELSNDISISLHSKLKEAIKAIIGIHSPSRNKLIRSDFGGYEWTNTLTKWFGEEAARSFYHELQDWYIVNKDSLKKKKTK